MAQLQNKQRDSLPSLSGRAWARLQLAVKMTEPKAGEEVVGYAHRLADYGDREKVWLPHLADVLSGRGWLVVSEGEKRVLKRRKEGHGEQG